MTRVARLVVQVGWDPPPSWVYTAGGLTASTFLLVELVSQW